MRGCTQRGMSCVSQVADSAGDFAEKDTAEILSRWPLVEVTQLPPRVVLRDISKGLGGSGGEFGLISG